MSDINLNWITSNFGHKSSIIFDIGCACLHDSIQMLNHTQGLVFAFECNPVFQNSNIERAKDYSRLKYHHVAISDKDGTEEFTASCQLDGQEWNVSGSLFAPDEPLRNKQWRWKEPISVPARSIESICAEYGVVPDFIHIDAQGAEYKILKSLPDYIRPKAVWSEITEFQRYSTGVTAEGFETLMMNLGYKNIFQGKYDNLYVYKDFNLSYYNGDKQ